MEGKMINGYTLSRRLGLGGMAEVWYAENVIGKKAAVKILLPELCQNEKIVERFLTEAKTMVLLEHPNIRQVLDYGNIDNRPAIVMEYLEGNDLKARMKKGQRFTEAELVKWWDQLVDALTYTHKKGIVHRDIKPGNIFVDNKGNIKLLDFGIAKVRESISSTQTGQKLGTLMYMSPEQVKDSKKTDYHTDIYSLAVTFVHLITGKRPYDSDTSSDFEISEQIVYKPLDLRELPDSWRQFLEPYLAKEAGARPELRHYEEPKTSSADDDATVYDEEPVSTPQKTVKAPQQQATAPQQPAAPKKKSKAGLWIALGCVVIAGVVAAVLLLQPDTKKKKQRSRWNDDDDYYTEQTYKTDEQVTDYNAYDDDDVIEVSSTYEDYDYVPLIAQNGWRDALDHCLDYGTTERNYGVFKGEAPNYSSSTLGIHAWPDIRSYYIGSFTGTTWHGYGIYISDVISSCKGGQYFVGEYDENGFETGYGYTFDSYGNMICNGWYNQGELTDSYSTNDYSEYKFECIRYGAGYYVGMTYQGQPSYYGMFIWDDGDMWYGEWFNGERDGYGIHINYNGSSFTGTWKGDTME